MLDCLICVELLKGVRGAYSEAAAEKAYPNCEAVPCDQFDSAFQVIASTLSLFMSFNFVFMLKMRLILLVISLFRLLKSG